MSINGSPSQLVDVISGMPQGSVLGPLLFIVYVDELDITIKSQVLKLADDTKLLRTSH